MTNSQAERLIAVLERIAKVFEGPTPEERLASEYQRSKGLLAEWDRINEKAKARPKWPPAKTIGATPPDRDPVRPLFVPKQPVDPDRPRS